MNQRDSIIANLYTGKNFTDCISKMEPEHLRDDLMQEVIEIVCSWPDDKIIKLHTDGVLEFYVARVIINQIQSNTSPFYKKYRQVHHTFNSRNEGRKEYYDANNDEVTSAYLIAATKLDEQLNHQDTDNFDDRQTHEALQDVAMGVVESWAESKDNSLHYRGNLIKLYMQVGTYRAMEKKTGIPFISCYKNIQQSIEMLRGMVLNKAVISRDELRTIQNDVPKIKIKL
jgi:hypothetical protein